MQQGSEFASFKGLKVSQSLQMPTVEKSPPHPQKTPNNNNKITTGVKNLLILQVYGSYQKMK